METNFNQDVYEFIKACNLNKVKMILVGGSAVNFYGYKRHSADIDFWIDNSTGNLSNLLKALRSIGYEFNTFPSEVLKGNQNISLKFSPDLELELITRFNPGKPFEQAFNDSVEYIMKGQKYMKWNIISLDDLINSKIKSGRPKDLLDVYELRRIQQS
jgi:hypothetical protein